MQAKVIDLMNQVKHAQEENAIGEERLEQKENHIQMLTRELESTKKRLKEKASAYSKFQKGLAKQVEELLT